MKDGEFNLADYIYDDSNNQYPKYYGTTFVKWWHIPLGRGFDNLHNAIGTEDGVMDDMCAPAVAILRAGEINGIAALHFAHEDAIA